MTATGIIDFLNAHRTTDALVVAWLGSNIVSALPSPTNNSNGFYKFFFALLHGLAGSVPRIFPNLRLPSDPTSGSATYFGNGKPDPNAPKPLTPGGK